MGELLKCGGVGIVNMLGKLYAPICKEECVPMKWREGLIVTACLRKETRRTQVIIEVLHL